MRIVVHDYAGHPFQVQLSRELAGRGHDVVHLHCAEYTTGKGALERQAEDPAGFDVRGVSIGEPLQKYSMTKRIPQETKYAKRLFREVSAFRPDAVISSNNPLFSQRSFMRKARGAGWPIVFWQQDIYSFAMRDVAARKLPVIGGFVGNRFVALEKRLLRQSDAVVVISDDFLPTLLEWGVSTQKSHVIENWAPLDEIGPGSQDNPWSRRHGLENKTVFLYSGTLGLKHNPELLLQLALRMRDRDDVRVVVNSEGLGADWLREHASQHDLPNLKMLGFQSYEDLPDVLATASVVIAILEREAGVYSVPSKVLTYHCAGRPILASIPKENLAARIIASNNSGLVVPPGDVEAFVDAAAQLLEDPERMRQSSRAARSYAERTFDIGRIGDEFERILRSVVS